MSRQFDSAWLAEREARQKKLIGDPTESVTKESDLHDIIIQHCKTKGWYVVHSRMDRASTNGVGTPDFIIAGPNGKTYWVECKAKGGKPSKEQLAAQFWLEKLGHKSGIVWSYEEFLQLVK